MAWLTREFDRMLAGFLVSTIAWNLTSMSLVLHGWRVWYMDDPLLSYTRIAFVGMWEACVYDPNSSDSVEKCYEYTHPIPLDILVCQHLLRAGSNLGLISHVCTILMLLNRLHMDRANRNAYSLFVLPGIINIIAGGCIFFAVRINCNAVIKMVGIDFPSSVPLPVKPDTQDIGSALIMAGIGSFLFLLSGNIFFAYPRDN